MSQLNPLFLAFAMIYVLLLGSLFFLYLGNMPTPSFEALIQPYTGQNSLMSIMLAFLVIPELFIISYMSMKLSAIPGARMTLLAFPEVIAVFGFMIGILNKNPWAPVPFFALGFAIYAYFVSRFSSESPPEPNDVPK